MKEIVHIRKICYNEELTLEILNSALLEIQEDFRLYQIVEVTRSEFYVDFLLLVEKR